MIRVGIVGYGTIGKRIADAVVAQDDMKIAGVLKVSPDYEAKVAVSRGFPVYTLPDRVEKFKKAGIEPAGTIEDLIKASDVVVDASPEDVGRENKEKYYQRYDKPVIFQGGEEADVAEVSFNALANYEEARGKRYVRVVSCNTTGITRVLTSLTLNGVGIKKARIFIARRGADPKEHKKGPINDVVPNPATVPSHHGPDVQTILRNVDIVTMAVAVPVTIMHMHMAYIELDSAYPKDQVIEAFAKTPRIFLADVGAGFQSLAQVIEYARDLGRPRGDFPEVAVFRDSVTTHGNELYLMYGVHQESIVVPENIDAIRSIFGTLPKWRSIEKTDKSLKLTTEGKRYG
ncbi:type II glyceraldehyde-3-phosphate dehydrogenase [Pyrobaculum neutrophilum]|uniref:Glyceraldehyde-3-phosphate dehydrogenase n=1 Tax=Pyrobaculum neutrophilum (strain DSM 2338 / JCM 9278 / NBRC 100436 / V24Sta) TaxID=444157 RepID=G3P_PYRNV|nr:type II glyceraldehyde-3-phosphate dehydrogenase [Pyrobaculum neutrophilum]B1YD06.1 RecName: Full=Glyceraldehyde-3-phosphate dehydrogenase; Short=GAPDH; AltName: Full=NAD(P)-dependent glyceraldehyde-3-phosphate dehydrogenase [Pyrobaculum neutrophilum V24Sta]ACB39669.1 glyceraldehyde-3-phosphate dehydrogenase, type II [Pyrobaculum neutrophilum V24Sta]